MAMGYPRLPAPRLDRTPAWLGQAPWYNGWTIVVVSFVALGLGMGSRTVAGGQRTRHRPARPADADDHRRRELARRLPRAGGATDRHRGAAGAGGAAALPRGVRAAAGRRARCPTGPREQWSDGWSGGARWP